MQKAKLTKAQANAIQAMRNGGDIIVTGLIDLTHSVGEIIIAESAVDDLCDLGLIEAKESNRVNMNYTLTSTGKTLPL